MTVTRTFTRRAGQRKDRYPNETEVIKVSEAEIEAARSAYSTYPNVSRATLACHVARMKGMHAGGRRCVTTVN